MTGKSPAAHEHPLHSQHQHQSLHLDLPNVEVAQVHTSHPHAYSFADHFSQNESHLKKFLLQVCLLMVRFPLQMESNEISAKHKLLLKRFLPPSEFFKPNFKLHVNFDSLTFEMIDSIQKRLAYLVDALNQAVANAVNSESTSDTSGHAYLKFSEEQIPPLNEHCFIHYVRLAHNILKQLPLTSGTYEIENLLSEHGLNELKKKGKFVLTWYPGNWKENSTNVFLKVDTKKASVLLGKVIKTALNDSHSNGTTDQTEKDVNIQQEESLTIDLPKINEIGDSFSQNVQQKIQSLSLFEATRILFAYRIHPNMVKITEDTFPIQINEHQGKSLPKSYSK